MGSPLKSGREMPSAQYFNLATWHTINFCTRMSWAETQDMRRQAVDEGKLACLMNLVRGAGVAASQVGTVFLPAVPAARPRVART
ncbi:hypothetical protein [Polaromonas sp.]|uniref:hypothetical protein n=1 Tax=Polaromonas sp. TaxID=1869339 RepID=UPI0027362CFB|nr:hypothetical protein [Polaromonas sp.]